MFVAHQLNAYEINEYNVMADMISYPNADAYNKYLYRDFLTTQLYPNVASITRFNLLLQQNKIVTSVLTPQPTLSVEFPQMNNAYRTKYYAWSYVVENPYSAGNSILKINVNDASGKQNSEYKAGSTVALSEPVFIAKPNSSAEDDGVLIIRGLDVGSEKGLLVVVDAKTMTEIGRANVPILIPFGFHNKFFATDSL
uniref:Uncharacterized protein n=1 Tax=Acrobeloides nanus TaxID=290746 RepID=A0A914CZ49_9BILA